MSAEKCVDLSKMSDRARRLVAEYSGGYVRIHGAEVVQFIDGNLQPVQLPADVLEEIVRATPLDGSYWVRQPAAAARSIPPKPKREDFRGDEVGYFKAAAAHHAAVADPTE